LSVATRSAGALLASALIRLLAGLWRASHEDPLYTLRHE